MNEFRTQVHSVTVEGSEPDIEIPRNDEDIRTGVMFLRDLAAKGWELRILSPRVAGFDVVAVDFTASPGALYCYWAMRVPEHAYRGQGLNHEFTKARELAARNSETLLRGLKKMLAFGAEQWLKETA